VNLLKILTFRFETATKMKSLSIPALCLISFAALSQKDDTSVMTYTTTGLELIFSGANIDQAGTPGEAALRFAPIINMQSMVHFDLSEKVGLFSGFGLRNVGYRMKNYLNPADGLTYEKAFRSYNLGIPIGFKVGNVKNMFLYAGYEIELAVLYKEKTYENNDKIDKITGWFSERQNIWQSSLLVGVQLPYGGNLKFKYYITDFHNQDYTSSGGVKPYAGLNSNVFYVSLTFFVLKNAKIYTYSKNSSL
jgi:hypothetical protein